MYHQNPNQRKIELAERVLTACIGKHGVWSDPNEHRYQCKTRDFVLGALPLLLQRKKSHAEVAKRHLIELARRQRVNGQIPMLFLDARLPFVTHELAAMFKTLSLPHGLTRYIGSNEWNLAPRIADSEILLAIGMHEYDAGTNDHSLILDYGKHSSLALRFVEHHLTHELAVRGCDWREAEYETLHDVYLLSNTALLYRAYKLMHNTKAQHIHNRIDHRFWDGNIYRNATHDHVFDPLGASLAVIYDAVPRDRYMSIVNALHKIDTPYGITCKYSPGARSIEERVVIERTEGNLVFPFVNGFVILALLKMGDHDFAEQLFRKLDALCGFREWYDPENGKGYSTHDSLMHAALYLRAAQAFEPKRH